MPIHYHKNPRQITKKQFADLQDSLKRLGDLSGIVHDLTSDEVIGGNQRMDVFDIKTAQIVIDERLPEPDEQGTVARGFVIWQGKKYSYRAVAWDDKTREEANIRANKAGGSWDFETLANEFEVKDLLEWGFAELELGITNEPEEPEKTEPETIPEQYMILIECTDEQTQAELLDRFNVEGLKCRALIS